MIQALKRAGFVVVCLMVAASLIVSTSCKKKSPSETLAEKMIEKASGGKAEVDIRGGTMKIKTAEGETTIGALAKWPSEIPADVPKFEGGKFATAAKMNSAEGTSWVMNFRDVDEAAVKAYIQGLKDAGWKENQAFSTPDSDMFIGAKGNLAATMAYIKANKGLSFTVLAKTEK